MFSELTRLLSLTLVLSFVAGLGAFAAQQPAPPAGSHAARTVILVNADQAESVALGEYYAAARGIPPANLIALPMPDRETITWRAFVDQIWQPLQDELLRRGWLEGLGGESLDPLGRKKAGITDRHLAYLVVCRGTPLRIDHDPTLASEEQVRNLPAQSRTNQGAVDSELSLIAFGNYEINGFIPNPLFHEDHPVGLDAQLVVKVARLDGPTLAEARGLITSALAGERDGLLGRFYVDLGGQDPEGDRWLGAVETQLEDLGFDGDVERTRATFGPAARFDAPVLYFGWYTQDLNGPFAQPGFHFPPGAIALHIHSYSAQTLHSTTKGWCGPLVARGVAATVGNVYEPYLQLTHRPDLLLRALARGDTLGDAAYFALPVLSWQSVLIGDPLYRPFKVTLAEQLEMLDRLPPDLAAYALVRQARLQARQGRDADAQAALEAGRQSHPGLVLPLAEARLAAERKEAKAVVAALDFLRTVPGFRPEEWPLAREAAVLLAQHGDPAAALSVYAALGRTPPPTRGAQRELWMEARSVAVAAGDEARQREFDRMLEEPPAGGP